MPSKKKKYNARFPPARIKKIMQADDEVGKVAAVVPVIISKTLEIFVGTLLRKACQVTKARNARTLTPAHLKATINSEGQFSFLREIVSSIPDINTNASDDDPSSSTEQGSNNTSSNARVSLSRKVSVGSRGSSRHLRTRAPRKVTPHASTVSETLSQDEDDQDDDEQMDSPSGSEKTTDNNFMARTLEIFVGSLLRKACQETKARNSHTLTPAHLKATINSEGQFSFLREIVSSIPDINTNASDDDPSSAPEQETLQGRM